jgi:small basic protein
MNLGHLGLAIGILFQIWFQNLVEETLRMFDLNIEVVFCMDQQYGAGHVRQDEDGRELVEKN